MRGIYVNTGTTVSYSHRYYLFERFTYNFQSFTLQALKIVDPTRVTLNDIHNGAMNGNLSGKPNSHMYNGIVSDVESDCKIDNRDLYGSVNSRVTFPHRVLPDRPKTPAGESTGNY